MLITFSMFGVLYSFHFVRMYTLLFTGMVKCTHCIWYVWYILLKRLTKFSWGGNKSVIMRIFLIKPCMYGICMLYLSHVHVCYTVLITFCVFGVLYPLHFVCTVYYTHFFLYVWCSVLITFRWYGMPLSLYVWYTVLVTFCVYGVLYCLYSAGMA